MESRRSGFPFSCQKMGYGEDYGACEDDAEGEIRGVVNLDGCPAAGKPCDEQKHQAGVCHVEMKAGRSAVLNL